jgi:hypothetical protein
MHYHNISIQICPDDPVEVERQSCSDNNNWFHIRELPVGYGILIDGATVEEVDAIVAAINVPIMRRRAELAAKIAAFRSDIFDEMVANKPFIPPEHEQTSRSAP